MTKKHFQELAAIAAEMMMTPAHRDGAVWLAHRLADMAGAHNSRFDRDRFLEACGIPGTPSCVAIGRVDARGPGVKS